MCAHDAQHVFIQTVIQENKAISLNHPVHSLQAVSYTHLEDIRDLQKRLDELWEMQKLILKRLSGIR